MMIRLGIARSMPMLRSVTTITGCAVMKYQLVNEAAYRLSRHTPAKKLYDSVEHEKMHTLLAISPVSSMNS